MLRIHPSHISTLFPYRTLFRSPQCLCERPGIASSPHNPAQGRSVEPMLQIRHVALRHRFTLRAALPHVANEDRKSTRLNSSHTVISYAVFCLKKKKETTNYHIN